MSEEKRVRATFDATRLNAFSFDPADLYLVEDPKDPLYDARVRLPLKSEFVDNVEALGVIEPVIVRKMPDGRAMVIDGRQRVRAARQINAAVGECRIMVPAVVRRGDEADAYTVTVSANAHRQDDPKREIIAKAQRLAQLGRGEADIAVALGVSVATAKRYVNANLKAPGPKKGRGKSKRPSGKEVEAYRKELATVPAGKIVTSTAADVAVAAVLEWVLGRGPRP